jgi:hypothetical protein
MCDRRAAVAAALAAVATLAALIPLPAPWVERWYSLGFYPRLQAILTPLSNRISISLVDIGVLALLAAGAVRVLRQWRRAGWKSAAWSATLAIVAAASVLYLVFLLTWGLNYRRVPLEQKLAYDPARVTRGAALQFARLAIQQVNDTHGPAHAGTRGASLEHAFADALRTVGHPARTVTGVPKKSLLAIYFRFAGIDGMTNPFFLDIVVNPDVLPMERPEVLAHEWAHLAGYADEAEANFISWLACVRGDPMAQYSGWLSLYRHVSAGLPREDRRALSALLAGGPTADLRAMAERHARGSPMVQKAQRGVYDAYLRANRVDEGIARYNAVARLVLGTTFTPGWTPVRRDS